MKNNLELYNVFQGRNVEKGHSRKNFQQPGIKLYQDSIYDKMGKNTDKFPNNGSKWGQCIKSACPKYRYQVKENLPNKTKKLNSEVPASSELRSTSSLSSCKKEEYYCCSNCCNKMKKILAERDSIKLHRQSSDYFGLESKCGRCNQYDHLREKGLILLGYLMPWIDRAM